MTTWRYLIAVGVLLGSKLAYAHPELLKTSPAIAQVHAKAPSQWQFRLYMPARLVQARLVQANGALVQTLSTPQLHSYWKEFALQLPAEVGTGCYRLQADIVGRDAITRLIEVPFSVGATCAAPEKRQFAGQTGT